MKRVFEKNDRYFKIARLALVIFCGIYQVCCLVIAIVMMCIEQIAAGVTLLLSSIFGFAMIFIIYAVIISFYADIKFIRNKLYNLESENVELVGGLNEKEPKKTRKNNTKIDYKKILELNELLKAGAIYIKFKISLPLK